MFGACIGAEGMDLAAFAAELIKTAELADHFPETPGTQVAKIHQGLLDLVSLRLSNGASLWIKL